MHQTLSRGWRMVRDQAILKTEVKKSLTATGFHMNDQNWKLENTEILGRVGVE